MNSLSEKTKHLLLAAAAPALLIGTVSALLHHLASGLDTELYGSLFSLGVIGLVLLLRKKNLPENLGLAQGSWQDCLQAAAMGFAYAAAIGIVPELLNAPSTLLDAVSLPTSDLMQGRFRLRVILKSVMLKGNDRFHGSTSILSEENRLLKMKEAGEPSALPAFRCCK